VLSPRQNQLRAAEAERSSELVRFSKTDRIPDPGEIRRLVNLGRERGLIHGGGAGPVKIEKNGMDVSTLGPLRTQWIIVTPELALKWLTNNVRNRTVSDDVVRAYARDMVNGEWVYTHQGLAFNDKDELIDGQHRLQAVILANIEVRMMVTFGLPSEIEGREMTTMDAVDRGRTRSVADQLKIQHGLKNGSVIASICNSIAPICSSERTRRLSVGQTLEIYRAFESPIHWVIVNRSHAIGLRQAGVMAGFAFSIATEIPKKPGAGRAEMLSTTPIMLMFEALVSGEGINPKSGMAHLRAFLTSDDARLLTRGSDRALAELVLQSIHLQLERKKIEKLEQSLDGANYFRSLQPQRVEKIAAMFALPDASRIGEAKSGSGLL
jgi:hypothetical protein